MSKVQKLTGGMERKYAVLSALSPLSMICEVVMEMLIPLMMASIVDKGIANHDIAYVLRLGLCMVLSALLSLSFGIAGARFSSVAAQGFSKNLRRKLFARVQTFSFSNMDKFGTGSLVTRLTTDVTNLQNLYQNIIRAMVRAPFMLITGTFMACMLNRKLSMVFLVVVPVLGTLLAVISVSAYPRFRAMFTRYDELNNTVQENLRAIRVVKTFVRAAFENKKFDTVAESLRDTQVRAEKIVIMNAPLMQLSVYSCIIAVLWFGGRMIIAGTMQTGELISFITYITQILMSLMMLSMMLVQLILSRASMSRVLEVLDEEPDIVSRENVSTVKDGSIDFNHVSFSYVGDAANCVLTDINLHIPSGATVGIIGGTGSSKSTLVQLLPRLYDVLSGSVMVGGVDVRQYDLTVLRDAVSMVLQKNVLFSGTIRENLRWGNQHATDEEIREACEASDADSFVRALPDGYETMLGQGGVNLSGGQKQRLCIARALLKKPRILILDDSTSACDTATDARIRSALRTALPGTTRLIIAQRIASVQDADMIVVMNDGVIAGLGTHEELLSSNEIYREVYESQNKQ
ncbi:MAG: ABC transporter ATP-binding protein/permease [Treponema sp.]|nr:ABC transporter ATP-binding protein/permease [Treponema sp.]